MEIIRQILGKPYYANEFVAIYNMDCKVGLQEIENHQLINCTITSPPYNIGKEYEKIITIEQYVNWLSEISHLIHNSTTKNGSYLLNLGYLKIENQARALPIPYLLWDKLKFFLTYRPSNFPG